MSVSRLKLLSRGTPRFDLEQPGARRAKPDNLPADRLSLGRLPSMDEIERVQAAAPEIKPLGVAIWIRAFHGTFTFRQEDGMDKAVMDRFPPPSE